MEDAKGSPTATAQGNKKKEGVVKKKGTKKQEKGECGKEVDVCCLPQLRNSFARFTVKSIT